MASNPWTPGRGVLKCPECGSKVTPNKGWARMFYDGYCNYCDKPVVNARHVEIRKANKVREPEE